MINDTPLPSKTVFLKSSQYTSQLGVSNYIFELQEPIKCNNNMDMFMNLDNIQFTNSFYTITTGNNVFAYEIQGLGSFQTTISVGFYGVPALAKLLNTTFLNVFSFSYNIYTYKYIITCGTPFKILPVENNCYDQLGFPPSGDDTFTTTKIPPNMFNMMAIQQLKVCIGNINLESHTVKEATKLNVLCALRVQAPVGGIQNYYNVSDFKFKINEENVTYLNVFIIDQNNRPVDFNGIEIFININFSFQYKKEMKFPNLITDDYKDGFGFEATADNYLREEYMNKENEEIDQVINDNLINPIIRKV